MLLQWLLQSRRRAVGSPTGRRLVEEKALEADFETFDDDEISSDGSSAVADEYGPLGVDQGVEGMLEPHPPRRRLPYGQASLCRLPPLRFPFLGLRP